MGSPSFSTVAPAGRQSTRAHPFGPCLILSFLWQPRIPILCSSGGLSLRVPASHTVLRCGDTVPFVNPLPSYLLTHPSLAGRLRADARPARPCIVPAPAAPLPPAEELVFGRGLLRVLCVSW